MYRLSDAYNSESSGLFATVIFTIGTALVFSIGLFLILNAHDNTQLSQTKMLNKAISDLKANAKLQKLTVNGTSNLNGTVTTGSDLSVGGNLDVNGDTGIKTALAVDGDTSLQGDLSVKSTTNFQGDLEVGGASTLQAGLNVTGDSNLGGNLTVASGATLTGDLSVTGASSLASLTVGGDTSLEGELAVTRAVGLTGDLDIAGSTAFQSTLTVGGSGTIDGSQTNASMDKLLGTALTLKGAAVYGGDFDVAGTAVFGDSLTVGGSGSFDGTGAKTDGVTTTSILLGNTPTIQVASTALFQGDFGVNGTAAFASTLKQTAINNITADFNPTVSFDGTGTFTSGGLSYSTLLGTTPTLQVQQAASFQGDFAVNGTSSFASTLTQTAINNTTPDFNPTVSFDATGNTTTGPTTSTILLGNAAKPSFEVTGASKFQGDFSVNGTTSFADTLTQTSIIAGLAQIPAGIDITSINPTVSFDATGTQTVGTDATTILLGTGTSFAVQKAAAFQGDFSVTGTASFADTLTQTAISNCTQTEAIDCSPDVIFDATGTNSVTGAVSLLSTSDYTFKVGGQGNFAGNLSVTGTASFNSIEQKAVAGCVFSDTTDCNPDNTFSSAYASDDGSIVTTYDASRVGFNVAGAAQLQGSLAVTGTAYFGSLTQSTVPGCVPNENDDCNPDLTFNALQSSSDDGNGNVTNYYAAGQQGYSYYINGAANITGAGTFDGTAYIGDSLTVNGTAEFGTLRACFSPACNNVIGAGHTSGQISAEGGFVSDGVNGLAVHDDVSDPNHHCSGAFLESIQVRGGIVTQGNCVGQQPTRSGSDNSTHVGQSGPETRCGGSGSTDVSSVTLDHGIVTGLTCDGGGDDYAEIYPSKQVLTAGDVVSIDTNNSEYVVKSVTANDTNAIGIVSTQPGKTIGTADGYPVALSGRVPVKVTNEGGTIAPGDYVTSSSTPGYAKKAGPNDKTIGQALESFTGTTGTVKVFVSVTKATNQNDSLQATLSSGQLGAANFGSLNVSGPTKLTDLSVTGTATIQDLIVLGTASVTKLVISGHITGNGDTRGVVTIPAGAKTVHYNFATPYDSVPTIVASPIGQSVLYNLNPDKNGFDVTINNPTSTAIRFSYLVQQ